MMMIALVLAVLVCVAAGAPEGSVSNPSPVYKPADTNSFVGDQPVYSPVETALWQPGTQPSQSFQSGNTQASAISGQPQNVAPGNGYGTHGNVYGANDGYGEVAYDVDSGYGLQTGYEGYLVPSGGYYGALAPADSIGPLTYLWGLLPLASTVVAVVGKGAVLLLSGAGFLLAGAVVVFGICSFTPFCSISLAGFRSQTIKEEVRSYITPDRISAAAQFVREAIDKYQKIQKASKGK